MKTRHFFHLKGLIVISGLLLACRAYAQDNVVTGDAQVVSVWYDDGDCSSSTGTYNDETDPNAMPPYTITCPIPIEWQTIDVHIDGLDQNCSYTVFIITAYGDTWVDYESGEPYYDNPQDYDVDDDDYPVGVYAVPNNCQHNISISGPSSVNAGENVTFTATIDNDPGGLGISWSGDGGSGSGYSFTTSFSNPGTYTVTASIDGENSNSSITITVVIPVDSVQAQDATHPTRIAGDGSALYLIAENSANISAQSSHGFPANLPVWNTGQTGPSFTDSRSSSQTYSAGGHSVVVYRMDKNTFNVSLAQFGPDPIGLDKYTPIGQLKSSVSIQLGGTSYKSETCEKYNDPGYDTKRTFSSGITANASLRLDLPKPYSFDAFGYAGYALYVALNGSGNFSGTITKDPSVADSSWQGGVSGSVGLVLEAGVRVYADIDVLATASGYANTQLTINGRNDPSTDSINPVIQMQGVCGGLVLGLSVKVTSIDNPSNVYLNVSDNLTVCDPYNTGWVTVMTL